MRQGLFALIVGLAALFAVAPPALAQQDQAEFERIVNSLDFRRGAIKLDNGLATIDLPDAFRYLGPADAQTMLTKLWGNPPGAGQGTLGMILPTDPSPFSPEGWAVIVYYNPAGYVSDEDAADLDAEQLMKDMQAATAEGNKERAAQGYEEVHLLGWAREPRYDAVAKKIHWGKRLTFGTATDETLNYEIRVLGRRGYLELNVVAPMSALPNIDQTSDKILAMVHFDQGNTYAEFNPDVDETAAYGIAGLIAGGLLTKAGFFKGLIALLIASKKLVAIGVVAFGAGIYAAIRRFFGRRGTPPNA
ncbi:DUF2167 domain-containing protein [Oleomonas cavernae]|nr:DUF2167 domain-containing protein [Oleomonas cavernae]